jgi:Pregnancy-associated plasma protein-A
MTVNDFSSVVTSLLSSNVNGGSLFRLVNIPLVYHILPNQDNGGSSSPSMTDAQRDFATQMTNKSYNIYDKKSKKSVQFASFVTDQTITHDDFVSKTDCQSLSSSDWSSIVTKADDWQFKMHVVICELGRISGFASFPRTFPATDPEHNLVRVDYRALACFDDDGNFLCDLTNGQQVSHTRWWRTRSNTIAHEIGHIFGLFHTFQGSCLFNDRVPDTPAQANTKNSAGNPIVPLGCPGLLPYDKDRSLFQVVKRKDINSGGNAETCGSVDDVCGSTCAACCTPEAGNIECARFLTGTPGPESISQDMVTFPDCCPDNTPSDTCKFRAGIDPLNNIMSYSPDFCSFEFTPGQMARMMAQTHKYKTYIYCNYSNIRDVVKCNNVPCFSNATSPNCA